MGNEVSLDGNSVKIKKLSYEHGGVYSCETVNEYPVGGRKVKTLLTIERELHVKSKSLFQ